MARSQAFRTVRDVAGDEVCGPLAKMAQGLKPSDARKLQELSVTTHNLRHLVVALLVTRDGSPCPFCQGPCNARCHLRRVLDA